MPSAMGFFASINGSIVPAAEARVSVLDNGFTFGDSVYETLRTYSGRPLALHRHLRRLRASADRIAVALPLDDGTLSARLDALLEAAGNAESYIRMIVTRGVGDISYNFDRVSGPTVVMAVKPYAPLAPSAYEDGVAAALVAVRRNAPDALDPAIKSCNLLNNILAVREAQSRGAIEAILLNHRGEVAEGAGSNVFLVRSGGVVTPPLSAGILAGITREILFEIAGDAGRPIREQTLVAGDLFAADEAFFTSTLKELAPIRTIDGRIVGSGRPGPVTRALLSAYRTAVPRYCRPGA
jgi:branched-chain amino acid aminotransferase